MNRVKDFASRLMGGIFLLALSFALALDNAREKLRDALGVKREPLVHGKFRPTAVVPNHEGERAMLGAALLAASALFLFTFAWLPSFGLALGVPGVSLAAAGTFALSRAANKPLPQYTFLGVYTGGSSDTSPLNILFSTYNATFAARCNGVAPVPNVYVVQTIGNVTAMATTCSATNFILTFTTSGSGLLNFVATIGATIPNTGDQP